MSPDIVGMKARENHGTKAGGNGTKVHNPSIHAMKINKRGVLKRRDNIDAADPKLDSVMFDHHCTVHDAHQCFPMVTIDLRRTERIRTTHEYMFAIILRAEKSFLGAKAPFPSMAST